MKIEMPALRELSFPDYAVLAFSCEPDARHAVVSVDGGWLADGGGRAVGPGRLVILGWTALQVKTFDPRCSCWSSASEGEELKDLCEAEFNSDQVVLRGFSKASGLWTEFTFSAPSAYYETDV